VTPNRDTNTPDPTPKTAPETPSNTEDPSPPPTAPKPEQHHHQRRQSHLNGTETLPPLNQSLKTKIKAKTNNKTTKNKLKIQNPQRNRSDKERTTKETQPHNH
jgi:hypothetical protein